MKREQRVKREKSEDLSKGFITPPVGGRKRGRPPGFKNKPDGDIPTKRVGGPPGSKNKRSKSTQGNRGSSSTDTLDISGSDSRLSNSEQGRRMKMNDSADDDDSDDESKDDDSDDDDSDDDSDDDEGVNSNKTRTLFPSPPGKIVDKRDWNRTVWPILKQEGWTSVYPPTTVLGINALYIKPGGSLKGIMNIGALSIS